jgi:alpha-tubulin suppressor-like RCC1 family protein
LLLYHHGALTVPWTRRKFLKTAVAGAPITASAPIAFGSAWKKIGGTTAVPFGVRWPVGSMNGATPIGLTLNSSVYVHANGTLFGTGSNSTGVLGSSAANRSSFSQVLGVSNIVAIGASNGVVMIIDSSGSVFGAGDNANGKLGDGSTIARSSYVQALGVSNATQISCGYNYTAVRTADGLVFSAGQNAGAYRLGVGDTIYRSTFIQGLGISNARAIACGFAGTIALRSDGSVFITGGSTRGESANGTGIPNSTFAQAPGISNAVAVGSTYRSHFALRNDGFIFGVGANSHGQLGDGTTNDRSTFVQMIGASQIIAIAVGNSTYTPYALRSDGMVFAVGMNYAGQIGDGGTLTRSTFVQALGLSQIVAIAPGFALRADGRLFAAGLNSSGQLGDGTTTDRSSFVAVL